MTQKYQKLKTLLQELFQLDQPDLDFGLYRVMHAKSAEVSQFLDKDLLPQVQAAFSEYKTADKAEIEKELKPVDCGPAPDNARTYGLDRDELRYILDPAGVKGADYPSETFRVLKEKKEIPRYGEFRTRRLILAAWDRLEDDGTFADLGMG